jgi:dihydrofolate reductase
MRKLFSDAQKIVFSKTLSASHWKNTVLARHELVKQVNELKHQESQDVIVYGGATFLSGLIYADWWMNYLLTP